MEVEEGPHALPEPDAPTGAGVLLGRCGRHPAQPLAGVCSSCLMERLSSVGSPEIVEVTPAAPRDTEGSSSGADQQGKLRKTLMLLFQMDDSHHSPSPSTDPPPESKNPPPSHPDPSASRGARWKRGSWLRSILPKRGARRRRTKDEDPPRPSAASVAADPGAGAGGDATPPQVERRASFRRSCEWMVCRDPPSASASAGRGEPPRHSWDGSMVGRALACSFACLDEPADGVTRVRHSNAEEPSSAGAAEGRNVAHAADVGQSFRERTCNGDAGPEMSVSGVVRRRSNRWSRVWDRSITSPLKEFVRKGEHALDRSLSESRKETRRCANRETADIVDGEVGRNGLVSGIASRNATRSSQPNGDAQSFRANRVKSKESKIGRSRSVHYTSPGNFDNGMLRFYLTPMRSNRSANRGRRRSSRLFSRGLFGFV
ncbi:uncharacterized protein LOC124694683 [Lolium rigidum]|uniref:uncharacterized protein LOC124694683 n=1 Tax=Lolium rigidum TaxID=89674 RepID=UPI001F5D3CCF|nr:uncharacterized protein LOC124694683 [Lolium rigidum]